MKSKVARKLALAIICCITAAVAAVMLAMSFKAFRFSDALMNSRNEATMNVLKANLQSQLDRLENTYTILKVGNGDISGLWDAVRQTDNDFAAVFDKDGSLIWQSDNYDLSDFMSARTNYSGVVDDSTAGLTIQVSKDLGDKVAVCGMKLSETGWLDDIKKEALAEVTVFSGKNRYATTLLQDGSRMKGSMNDNVANEVFSDKGTYTGTTSIDGQKYYVLYDVITDIGGKQVGAFFSGISAAESDAQRASLITGACIICFAAIAASVMILITMTMKIVVIPIQEAGRIADSMSKGKLKGASVDMPLYDDEIGSFVRKLENTCGTLDSYISDIGSVLSRIAGGDFTVSASVGYVGEFTDISDSFDNINKSLTGLIGEIRRAANDVTSGASQIADGASDLASGATEQASSVEELSASIGSIADKVTASAGAAKEISEMSDKSLNYIMIQKGSMSDMLNSMAEIKERSDSIEGIIKVIDDIAFQTNILALNASIEAARAGDAGKGFAVVAGEVGSLAEKSAESAKRTAELIKLTIEAVDKGSAIAESTAESMNSVASMSEDIRNKVMGIAAASGEEARALEDIKSSVSEISNVVIRTTATAEQTASACVALNSQADRLSRQLAQFRYN